MVSLCPNSHVSCLTVSQFPRPICCLLSFVSYLLCLVCGPLYAVSGLLFLSDFPVCYSPYAVPFCCVLSAVSYLPSTACHSLSFIPCLLCTVFHVLSALLCLLPPLVMFCLLYSIFCVLSTMSCLSSAVCYCGHILACWR